MAFGAGSKSDAIFCLKTKSKVFTFHTFCSGRLASMGKEAPAELQTITVCQIASRCRASLQKNNHLSGTTVHLNNTGADGKHSGAVPV